MKIPFFSIPTHRHILQESSKYFKALLMHSGQDNQQDIVIENVPGHLLLSFVTYCFTKTMDINDDNVDQVLSVASLLQFNVVERKCIDHLMCGLDETNCLGIWLLTDQYDHLVDRDIALDTALELFREVIQHDEFVNLKVEPLEILLGHDDLNVHSEEDVFEAVQRWIDFDADKRMCELQRLFALVRVRHLQEAVNKLIRLLFAAYNGGIVCVPMAFLFDSNYSFWLLRHPGLPVWALPMSMRN